MPILIPPRVAAVKAIAPKSFWDTYTHIPCRHEPWLPCTEARKYVQGLGLKDSVEWSSTHKPKDRPFDLPDAPHEGNELWADIRDLLDTGNKAGKAKR